MLIYLSSYPRSGNTWSRHLVRHYFGYRSASVYPEPQGAPNLELRPDGTYELFSSYTLLHDPTVTMSMLVNNCGSILSLELRQRLAEAPEPYFLKTHERPFAEYLPGEFVVFVVREPGAVCWSYYNYLRKNNPELSESLRIEDVIDGRVLFGSWSDHNRAWLAAAEQLGERFLLQKYEDLSSRPETEFCDRLVAMTGLSYPPPAQPLPGLEHWHAKAPTLYRKEATSDWQERMPPDQIARVYRVHREMMGVLGYALPPERSSWGGRLWRRLKNKYSTFIGQTPPTEV